MFPLKIFLGGVPAEVPDGGWPAHNRCCGELEEETMVEVKRPAKKRRRKVVGKLF